MDIIERRVRAIMVFLVTELANGPVPSRVLRRCWCDLPPSRRTGRGHNDDGGQAFAEARRRLGITTRMTRDGGLVEMPTLADVTARE